MSLSRIFRSVVFAICESIRIFSSEGNSTVGEGGVSIETASSCGCISSVGEANIQKVLQENNIVFEKQKTFSDLISNLGGYLRYDFYLP